MKGRREIRTVLVANRGEIARRIFRACRQVGLISAAITSEADRESVWSRDADLVVPLAGVTAAETYLDIDAVLAAAREVGADAIHPGYGFLSENADFAAACDEAGVIFVGPTPEAMRRIGSKVGAREAARAAGVPVVPGADGADLGAEGLARAAEGVGYPLLVKASAGGGGRGMRLVRAPDVLAEALAAAAAEAQSAFGDDRLLLERFFERARHVEVQVLGDHHGGLVHLFERECSVQRRHQKLVEESPSPAIDAALRAELTAAAVRVAEEAGYTSAGTVEFLLDEAGRFYLLEVNTRLQVEHPVTELVTGLDIVAWQLRIAQGEPLGFGQADLRQQGHAVECRVYAEDPARGFLPASGHLTVYRAPSGPGVRCDDGVGAGATVSPFYDPLLAKVITHGADRDTALRRMDQALADTVALGVTTNVPFLQAVVGHPAFRAGDLSTRFLETHLADWAPRTDLTPDEWLAVAAFEALSVRRLGAGEDAVPAGGPGADPWTVAGAWRNVP